MIFKWETCEERVRRFMKMPAKKKLEWLQDMSEFTKRCDTQERRKIRLKLRELRG